jgi:hypothetical protein
MRQPFAFTPFWSERMVTGRVRSGRIKNTIVAMNPYFPMVLLCKLK